MYVKVSVGKIVSREEHERIGDIIKKYGHFLKVWCVQNVNFSVNNHLYYWSEELLEAAV